MISFSDELQGLHIANQIIFLRPLVHVVSHLIRTEVRDQQFLSTSEFHTAQFLQFLHNYHNFFLTQFLYKNININNTNNASGIILHNGQIWYFAYWSIYYVVTIMCYHRRVLSAVCVDYLWPIVYLLSTGLFVLLETVGNLGVREEWGEF